jgi:hypothetical protein
MNFSLSSLLSGLLNILTQLWETVTKWVTETINFIFTYLIDLAYTIYDTVLTFFESMLEYLPVPDVSQLDAMWSHIPSATIHYIHLFKIDYCFGIIITAIVAKSILRLVPLIRLTS